MKHQDTQFNSMKGTVKKLEEELSAVKGQAAERDTNLQKKINFYKTRFDQINTKYIPSNPSYMALKRRRDYEIEGFTSDIISLRKQLRVLEKSILKYGALEDKELVLLNLGRYGAYF